MYKIGQRVVYGVHGVCQIIDLQTQMVNRKKVEYYVLEPVSQSGSCFFVPSQSATALSKLRPILTREEIDHLLSTKQINDNVWIDDESQRKQYYRQLLVEGRCDDMLNMIRALHIHKQEQLSSGKKFHISDANFLKDAEKVVYSEFSIVLGIPYDQIETYIEQF